MFIGSPQDMRRRYLDAFALVYHPGKIDLFTTMTCKYVMNRSSTKFGGGTNYTRLIRFDVKSISCQAIRS